MGYALFAQRKLVLSGQLNSAQMQQTQRSNEQFNLATNHSGLQRQISALGVAQAQDLAAKYRELSETNDTDERNSINAEIQAIQQEYKIDEDEINNEIYLVSMKEQAIELEVKRLDTVVTTLKQQLQDIQQAEGDGIQNATPKFSGIS